MKACFTSRPTGPILRGREQLICLSDVAKGCSLQNVVGDSISTTYSSLENLFNSDIVVNENCN